MSFCFLFFNYLILINIYKIQKVIIFYNFFFKKKVAPILHEPMLQIIRKLKLTKIKKQYILFK